MAIPIVIVENLKDWQPDYPAVRVIAARDYLSRPEYLKSGGFRVINLCRSYRYLSIGYYCSLLAEPRRHRVIPSVRTLTSLSSKSIYSLNVEDLDGSIQRSLKKRCADAGQEFALAIFFGRSEDPELQDLARQIFDLFPCPLLKVEFRYQGKWQLDTVKALPLNGAASGAHRRFFIEALTGYLNKPLRAPKARSLARWDLAILCNSAEKMPPSNPTALHKFVKAGKKLGVDVELIEKKDYERLPQYDALFLRETTAIDHYTYRFAKKAELEGLVVIDDPDSILKCTNKVYLSELMATHRIPAPKTRILQKGDPESLALGAEIGFPVVLKIPDGSFSRGVYKADSPRQYKALAEKLFKDSDLLLAQEFLYTQFDWRIGVLRGEALFACQYFMSRAHWQVVKHQASGRAVEGGYRTLPLEAVPDPVLQAALNLARLIGDGLYGVDLKQTADSVFAIEINDNPNIDAGIEDQVLGDRLYERIIGEFVQRLESGRRG
ncbi:RimK family protein [Candidatus Methylocalor cossyra]|uniref:Ribosomal protein S6 glutaminyl transferase related protein n=1 Tax=Candidatus Methylocalor cossyra TaxID=3108543 RepID=A0ABP1C7N2_9GAMM